MWNNISRHTKLENNAKIESNCQKKEDHSLNLPLPVQYWTEGSQLDIFEELQLLNVITSSILGLISNLQMLWKVTNAYIFSKF